MLFLKMIRDIKKNFVQFIVIFLMAFMGTFVFSGISAEWYGIEKIVKDYTAEANFADIWVYGKNFSKDDLDTIKNLKGIIEVERRVSIEGIGDFANNPKLELHFLEDNSINKPKLVEGEEIDLNKSEGIWIDKNFAKEKKLKIGDTLKCTSNGVSIEKEILGIIESPEYIYYANEEDLWPDYAKIGYAYLSIEAFPYKDKAPYTTMLVKANRTDTSKLEDEINTLIKDNKVTIVLKENMPSYKAISNEVEQHKVMGGIFPVAFILIAILAMLTTMTRLVNNQRIQIGTLKAIGFSNRKIMHHYLSYGFYLSTLGALLGAILGPITLPYLFSITG